MRSLMVVKKIVGGVTFLLLCIYVITRS